MTFRGFLSIPDIAGESRSADHEDEINIHGLQWKIEQDTAKATGRGRRQSRATVGNFIVTKFTDAASPYLALACLQGKSIPEITIALRKDSGEAHLDYLIITMKNCQIASFDMDGGAPNGTDDRITESVALSFEQITKTYTIQADDHSAGDEHEITFDIAAGV